MDGVREDVAEYKAEDDVLSETEGGGRRGDDAQGGADVEDFGEEDLNEDLDCCGEEDVEEGDADYSRYFEGFGARGAEEG